MSKIDVGSGQTSSGLIVTSGNFVYVTSGGTTVHTTVQADAQIIVDSDAMALDTTLQSGGQAEAQDGGMISGLTIAAGASLFVQYGGIATNVTVAGVIGTGNDIGGTLTNINILPGGTADLSFSVVSKVTDAGVLSFYESTISDVTIDGGVSETVDGPSTDTGTTILSGGTQIVSGATVNSVAIKSGAREIVQIGTINGAVIASGAQQTISSGAATNETIHAGGRAVFYAGVTATGTILSGGIAVEAGDRANYALTSQTGATVDNSGVVFITSTTLTSAANVDKAVVSATQQQFVLSGGITNNTYVLPGGLQMVAAGGIASGTILDAQPLERGEQDVDGGTAIATRIEHYGVVRVFNGGRVIDAVNVGGGVGAESGGLILSGLAQGGQFEVSAGGIASALMLGSGGSLVVENGGTADSTIVGSGGILQDDGFAGNHSKGVVLNARHGVVADTIVQSGGKLELGYVGDAASTTLQVGGTIILANEAWRTLSSTDVTLKGSNVLLINDDGRHAAVQLAGNYTGAVFAVSGGFSGGTITLISTPSPAAADMMAEIQSAGADRVAGDLISHLAAATDKPDPATAAKFMEPPRPAPHQASVDHVWHDVIPHLA